MILPDRKPYNMDAMKEYCKENIDKYNVEPIIKEAFQQGLISPAKAFIHLRIEQMIEGKETISCSQIAQEAGVSNATITKYKQDPLIGISQKVFIQLLIKTHIQDWKNMCESNKPNEALTEYVNKYRRMIIYYHKDKGFNKADYELKRETAISKEVCRKTYDELVSSRTKGWGDVTCKDVIIRTEVIDNSDKLKVRITVENLGRKDSTLECNRDRIVHELVAKLSKIIGGLISGIDGCDYVYLHGSSNRKINLAMECIALSNERVFLL